MNNRITNFYYRQQTSNTVSLIGWMLLALLTLLINPLLLQAQESSEDHYVSDVWVADNGDGTYTNPILHADYSDPDVVRKGDDYYMTASSFNAVPGLPILHSKDLVNW
ncbi:MAG TPA: family 43 glycosylhydrolase, partial [Fodinibius sp.]|nr:family 43 glycosylhydrolase [Fodinibius sp.]